MANRIYALVDCNNFYASCERVFNPTLNRRPIVVLSNNDGCVIARSNEAKAIGIGMGVPVHQVKDLILKHNVQIFSANFTLYGDFSNRVMSTLSMFAPEVEIYSVDEAFLNLSGIQDPYRHAQDIRQTVLKWLKLPLSIGVAHTKTLSKIGNHIAKRYPKTGGIVDLTDTRLIEGALKITPVNDVWGVGRRFAKKLENKGIKTAYDLTFADDVWIMKNFSVVLMRTIWELRGIPCIEFETLPPPKKNIMTSRSFGRQVRDYNELKQAVATYASRGSEKLRADGLAARSVMVFIHTNLFRPWEPQYSESAVIRMPVPSNSAHELIQYAEIGLRKIYKQDYGYHKAGVMCMELVPEGQIQQNLLDFSDRDKWGKLDTTLDFINLNHGQGTIRYGSEGVVKRWRMRQSHKSQRFTTSWAEVLTVTS